MKFLFTVFYLFFLQTFFSQQIEREVISNAGEPVLLSNGYRFDWNLGETIVTTESSTSVIFTQGFEQPNHKADVSIDEENYIDITVYPNPFTGYIELEIQNFQPETLELKIYDISGKLIFSKRLQDSHEIIELRSLSGGVYMFYVTENQAIKYFTGIIKQ